LAASFEAVHLQATARLSRPKNPELPAVLWLPFVLSSNALPRSGGLPLPR
jgi:hypothetical protein